MVFIRLAVPLLLIITLVGGVATDSVDTGEKDLYNTTRRRLYPFTEAYYKEGNTPVVGALFDKTLGGTATFHRASPQSLPEPSYACGYTANQDGRLIKITLNNGCLALIRDSHGIYDRSFLTGMRIKPDYSVLTIPRSGGEVDTYDKVIPSLE
ncbi:hypothetical protein FOZ60_007279 [Perkinsus olseni]|uniref:Uncharacterized protein n=2 Tax=Perkinsus olseni TaxID=32597 RepID=A0A7J6NLR2_PEROL|nr:hypothetical protein FOZ60_007279 [Perkinsus olseni]